MILPYLLRLLCLCLASFFLAHILLALAVWITTPAAIRRAERMRPRLAAKFLLALRMLPLALALLVVLGFCVPSYLRFEPKAVAERVGWVCFGLALLGVAIWTVSVARVLRAIVDSARYSWFCQKAGRETRVPGQSSSVLVVAEEAPILAVAGVVRPQFVISDRVMCALSAEQLDAALRHERAHRMSRDNLKRLLLLLAPDIFPFSRAFAALESGWARFAEWAADDQATEGDSWRALSLAAALVCVARMGAAPRMSLLTSLIAGNHDLSSRVDRLLRAEPSHQKGLSRMRTLVGGTALVMVGFVAVALLSPATLYSVHRLLEQLVR
jgi:beta-lactamase regulating signal transducer with metallopeptidase domain